MKEQTQFGSESPSMNEAVDLLINGIGFRLTWSIRSGK